MSSNTRNYLEQGGAKTVIGGELEFLEGATVTGFPASALTPAANQADSTAETLAELVTDFNALLTKLKAAGFMSS